jgi:hypothetical protein
MSAARLKASRLIHGKFCETQYELCTAPRTYRESELARQQLLARFESEARRACPHLQLFLGLPTVPDTCLTRGSPNFTVTEVHVKRATWAALHWPELRGAQTA